MKRYCTVFEYFLIDEREIEEKACKQCAFLDSSVHFHIFTREFDQK